MTKRCLPLVSLPNDVVPVTSANIPASFGARASNNSATRGRPPIMSRVFCDSFEVLKLNPSQLIDFLLNNVVGFCCFPETSGHHNY